MRRCVPGTTGTGGGTTTGTGDRWWDNAHFVIHQTHTTHPTEQVHDSVGGRVLVLLVLHGFSSRALLEAKR